MDEQALIDALFADRDADETALVYADWLEENGDPAEQGRAAFIRAQVELARLPEEDPRAAELRELADNLHHEYVQSWGDLGSVKVKDFSYRRGFVEWVDLNAGQFLAKANRLFALAPVRGLALRKAGGFIGRLVQIRHLAKLRRLVLRSPTLESGEMPTLVGCPYLSGLAEFACRSTRLDDNDVRSLAAAKHWTGLVHLDLGYNNVRPSGALSLAGSGLFHNLEYLDLHFNELGPEGTTALAGSPILQRVRHLDLGFNEVGDAGAVSLASSPLRRPTFLNLAHGHISDGVFQRLTDRADLWPELKHLELQYNDLADGAATGLAAAALDRLTLLNLSKNRIGPAGVEALANSPNLTSLKDLDVESNPIGTEGALALANSGHLENLQRLTISAGDLSPEAISALRERFGDRLRWWPSTPPA